MYVGYVDDKVINQKRERTLSSQANITMSIRIELMITEDNSKDYNCAIWKQAEEIESIQFVLHSSLCSATNDVYSLNEKEIDDDLKSETDPRSGKILLMNNKR
jgi:hypothetical protein